MPERARIRPPHPLDHQAAFRAVVAAAPAIAQLSAELASKKYATDLVGMLTVASSDLGHGFGAPPDSVMRKRAHHRAWVGVRQIDRVIGEARRRHLVPADVLGRAQRAVDRADVMISSLPGVLAS